MKVIRCRLPDGNRYVILFGVAGFTVSMIGSTIILHILLLGIMPNITVGLEKLTVLLVVNLVAIGGL